MSIATATGVQFAAGQPFYDHLLTNFFVPLVVDARNNSCVLYSQFEKVDKRNVSGRFIVWPVLNRRNTGRGSIAPGGDLPDPGRQGATSYGAYSRLYYGRIMIDGQTFDRGLTNGGAFIEAMDVEMRGQADDMCVEMNRQLHNDGSGRIAEVSAVSTTVITLKVNQSLEGAANATLNFGKYLEVGDRISFVSSNGSALTVANDGANFAFWVVTILTATTIEVSATEGGAPLDTSALSPTAVAANMWVVRASNQTATAGYGSRGYRTECMGIGGVYHEDGVLDGTGIAGVQQSGSINTVTNTVVGGNFQGLPATSANSFNRGIVLDNGVSGSRPISEALLQQAFSDAEEINNADIKLMLSGYGVYNQYVGSLTGDKRFNDTLTLKGGHKTVSFNDVPWLKDRFCYGGRVYMMDPDQFWIGEVKPLGPMMQVGVNGWERVNGDKDAYWRGISGDHNLFVNCRNRVGAVLVDLNV